MFKIWNSIKNGIEDRRKIRNQGMQLEVLCNKVNEYRIKNAKLIAEQLDAQFKLDQIKSLVEHNQNNSLVNMINQIKTILREETNENIR